jgi:hypothetical protein
MINTSELLENDQTTWRMELRGEWLAIRKEKRAGPHPVRSFVLYPRSKAS